MDNKIQNLNLVDAYFRLPIEISHADNFYLVDTNGKEYIDFASGFAVTNLGHNVEYINNKLKSQIDKIWHCSNLFYNTELNKLAQRLVDLTFADSVFFCSSGLEAVEAAIKFIRKYHFEAKTGRNKIITFKNGFHGRSIACLSGCSSTKAKEGFAPFLDDFIILPINDLNAFSDIVAHGNIAGVIIEPTQSEGGVYPVDKSFLQGIRDITLKNNIILCLDEVQTGYNRTGTLFKYQQLGFEPDMMTIAKGMGNGFPVGACLVKSHIAAAITPGTHGSTFGGNPLAMAASNAVLDIMLDDKVTSQVLDNIKYFEQKLAMLKESSSLISQVRQDGLIIGIEVKTSAKELVIKLCEAGLIVTRAGNDNVLRILPPLTIAREIIDDAFIILQQHLIV
jgi:acetylornithine/N-succinyldiaminopimelate aminotransferase